MNNVLLVNHPSFIYDLQHIKVLISWILLFVMCGALILRLHLMVTHIFILCVDHFSKFMWIFPLKQKYEVFDIFKRFLVMVERKYNTKLKSVQTDWRGEFRPLPNFFSSIGVIHWISCPHTSEQNGLVERRHRHVVEQVSPYLPLHMFPNDSSILHPTLLFISLTECHLVLTPILHHSS